MDNRKPQGAGRKKPEGPIGRAEKREGERPAWQTRVHRERTGEKSPLVPSEITPEDLDISLRVQLKTLTAENAEMVARHLAMVGLLINDDPELAHKHALAAARRAGRLGLVHETLGVTAYAIGDYALALRELLTHRRVTGSNDQLPLIVDSERGMGRPAKALEVATGIDRSKLPVGVRINLAIALSGARLDLDQKELALEELEIPELTPKSIYPQSPLLFRSYAECLRDLGRDAADWESLADRAEQALSTQGEELFEILEEIKIPTSEEFERKPAAKTFDKKPFPKKDGEKRNFSKGGKSFGGDRKNFKPGNHRGNRG